MNGVHDMGGFQDMGFIQAEKNEPVFHAPWEGRVFAMVIAVDGDWTEPGFRHEVERMPPVDYLRISYYEKWLRALTAKMLETGLITQAELDSGKPVGSAPPKYELLKASQVAQAMAEGGSSSRDTPAVARFRVGQIVRALNVHPGGHTRLPRYVRGHEGTIVRDYGVFSFPDMHVDPKSDKPQHLYSVRFAARKLWGTAAAAHDAVYLDLWDDYLEHT